MLTDLQLLQIKNSILRILHIPGNYTGGILEMAVVADYHMPCGELREECRQIAGMLKRQDEFFRNVRLNLLEWISDEIIIKEVTPMPYLQMGRVFQDYGQREADGAKTLDELCRQLKLFYARSKVILVLTDGSYRIGKQENLEDYLQPFLWRKRLLIENGSIERINAV